MNLIYCALFLGVSFSANCQLPTVHAKGGIGTNVDWPKIQQEYNVEEGPGYFYNDCSQGVEPLKASSTLTGQGTKSYGVKNLYDADPLTAWVEGRSDYGIGESFEVKAVDVNTIYNGYQSSPANWKNNSRVKKFKVYMNNVAICYLNLTDEMGEQQFDLPVSKDYNFDKPSVFKFEIVDVYKGLKWSDVAICEIDLVLCCFMEGTIISSATEDLPIGNLEAGELITTYDQTTGAIGEAEVVKSTKQIHVKMLRVSTGTKTIEITEDHPLYFKDHGYASLSRLKTILETDNYDSLLKTVKVMTWNESTKQSEYEPIVSVEILEGKFTTYSIMKLAGASTYIANGFITKTY